MLLREIKSLLKSINMQAAINANFKVALDIGDPTILTYIDPLSNIKVNAIKYISRLDIPSFTLLLSIIHSCFSLKNKDLFLH